MEGVGSVKGVGVGPAGKQRRAFHTLQADTENFCPNKILGKWIRSPMFQEKPERWREVLPSQSPFEES